MNIKNIYYTFGLLAFFLTNSIQAQDDNHVHFTTYRSNSNTKYVAIEGDTLWQCTENGLVKRMLNGKILHTYLPANSALPDGNINSMVIDYDGVKWLNISSMGLARLSGEGIISYTAQNSDLNSNIVYSIAIDIYGDKWVGSEGGLNRISGTAFVEDYNRDNSNLNDNDVTAIAIDSNDTKWLGCENGWLAHLTGDSVTLIEDLGNEITRISIDEKQDKWIGTIDGKLYKLSHTTLTQVYNFNVGIVGIDFDKKGNQWIATDTNGIYKTKGASHTHYTSDDGLPVSNSYNNIHHIVLDDDDHVWIGYSESGLVRLSNNGTVTKFDKNIDDLKFLNSTSDVEIDQFGNKWIGAGEHLLKMFEKDYEIHFDRVDTTFNWVRDLAIDKNNDKWVGTWHGLYHVTDSSINVYTTENSNIPNSAIKTIAIDSNNNKWFGYEFIEDLNSLINTTFTNYQYNNSSGGIYQIAIDSSGVKWMAFGIGILKFYGENFTLYDTVNGGTFDKVTCVAVDVNDNKWFGTENGLLLKMSDTVLTVFDTLKVPGSNPATAINIRAIAVDANGNKWVGTKENGLLFMTDTSYTFYTRGYGLNSNQVEKIIIEDKNDLWIIYNEFETAGFTHLQINKPNLAYYQTDGWNAPMILSREPNNQVNDTMFFTGQDTLFIDFSIINNGHFKVDPAFSYSLKVDSMLYNATFEKQGVTNPGEYLTITDYQLDITSLDTGYHTLTLVIDEPRNIEEYQENDNMYEVGFYIMDSVDLHLLKPKEWENSMVISTTRNTFTDDTTYITNTDSLYIDYAFSNTGNGPVQVPFNHIIQIDSAIYYYTMDSTVYLPGDTNKTTDIAIPPLDTGYHQITVAIDTANAIFEYNEANNSITRTIYVTDQIVPEIEPSKKWEGALPLVTSNAKYTYTDDTLFHTNDFIYVHFAIANVGGVDAENVYVDILVNDTVKDSGYTPILEKDSVGVFKAMEIGNLKPGDYEIKMIIDPENIVAEFNEQNNIITKNITVTDTCVDCQIEVETIASLRAVFIIEGQIYRLTGSPSVTYSCTDDKLLYIQDSTAAIAIFDPNSIITHNYQIGNRITGLTGFLRRNSSDILEFIPIENPSDNALDPYHIKPDTITISDFNNNFTNYESELVKTLNLHFEDSGKTFSQHVLEYGYYGNDSILIGTHCGNADYLNDTIPAKAHITGIAGNDHGRDYIIPRSWADIDTISPKLPFAAGTISGPTEVCKGETVGYSVEPIPQAESYTWVLPDGRKIENQANSINVEILSDEFLGEVKVFGHNAFGAGDSSKLNVHVYQAAPFISDKSGEDTVCIGDINYTYSVDINENVKNHVWRLNGSFSDTTSFGDSLWVSFNQPETSSIIFVATNTCGWDSTHFPVNSISVPAAPAEIVGLQNVCAYTTKNYSVAPLILAASYVWEIPSTATGISESNSIQLDFKQSGTNNILQVRGKNKCGLGNAAGKTINVFDVPENTGDITGTFELCGTQENITYALTGARHFNTLLWNLPEGFTYTASDTTITVNTSQYAQSGNISVMARNQCGDSDTISRAITIKPMPETPEIVLKGDRILICLDSGLVYQWYQGIDTILIENANKQYYYINGEPEKQYTVSVTNEHNCTRNAPIFNMDVSMAVKNAPAYIYPNPLTEQTFTFQLNAPENGEYIVQLIDIKGKPVKNWRIELYQGQNERKVQVGHLAKGVYLMVISNKQYQYNTSIIVE